MHLFAAGIPYGGSGSVFGGGSNRLIFLDDVDCEGTEESLLLCRTPGIGEHNCGTRENAGVFCPGTYSAHVYTVIHTSLWMYTFMCIRTQYEV